MTPVRVARGVTVLQGTIFSRHDSTCILATGQRLPCDMLVTATGLVGASLSRRLGFELDPDGRILVEETLQALSNPRVLAVGDCAVVQGNQRPPVGVFGVRGGPVLVRNLMALVKSRDLIAYRPQRRWLFIMDLGDGTGIAVWGGGLGGG